MSKDEVVSFLKKVKRQASPKDKHKQRLSEKVRDRALEDVREESEDELQDDLNDEDIPEGSYQDVFDREGKVIKVPHYEEFYFVCKTWLAMDEGDGLLERELMVKKKSVVFKDFDTKDKSVVRTVMYVSPSG